MKRYLAAFLLILHTCCLYSQASFKVLFKTYPTGSIQRIYDYDYAFKDDVVFWLLDSSVRYISKDSMVILTINYPVKEKWTQTVDYLNAKKQIVKTEHFIQDYLYKTTEWKYDTQNHVTYHAEIEKDSKIKSYTRCYSFDIKKTPEGCTEVEHCSLNGKQEFTTFNYYDKKHNIQKQVRENDAHKAMHIETYNYSSTGKLLSREVFFPEFGVTKYYKETWWDTKCYKAIPYTGDLITVENKEQALRKELLRNKIFLQTNECENMEYTLNNFANTLIFKKGAEHNKKIATVVIKEKIK